MAIDTIDMTDAAWYSKLNSNFEKILDLPFPIKTYADEAALITDKNPKLYKNTFALVNGVVYSSNGTVWAVYRELLTYIADLNTGTATVADVKNAFNGLLADARSKGWILT